ncbi:MAG: GTP-binding protein [Kofleriaceae bacterium]|jgi:G3E family GTPase|nr:GTP-binding protein [Kofleriaceae bacterium]
MIPVYLVTGFLGAGKTTLINALLRRRAARPEPTGRIALIVNELGEVGVDGDLLPADAARQIELPGGCVCCVLSEELDATVLALVRDNPGLDAIVIETTGVAEPLPIAWTLERSPLREQVRLAAVITVVDATGFVASRSLSPSVDAQVAAADVLIVAKGDLVEPPTLDAACAAVRTLAPVAPLRVLGPDDAAAWLEALMADPDLAHAPAGHEHPHEHEHAPAGPGHGHGLTSVWAPIDEVLDLEELEDALAALPAGYVRIKGLARVVDGRTGHDDVHGAVFHRVGTRVSSEPLADPSGPVRGRVVAIGAAVSRQVLAQAVAAAVLPSSGSAGATDPAQGEPEGE